MGRETSISTTDKLFGGWFLSMLIFEEMLWLDTIQILKYMITFVFVFFILESQPIILATDINTVVVLF